MYITSLPTNAAKLRNSYLSVNVCSSLYVSAGVITLEQWAGLPTVSKKSILPIVIPLVQWIISEVNF